MKMVVLQPFFSDTLLSKSIRLSSSSSSSCPTLKGPTLIKSRTLFSVLHQPPETPYPFHNLCLKVKKSGLKNYRATVEQVEGVLSSEIANDEDDPNLFVGSSVIDEETKGECEKVKYDWSEEWYPLYLTENVPDDAPLGLTVFDKQLVLYKDGNGELRCFEDRCPHRYLYHSFPNPTPDGCSPNKVVC